MAADPRVGFTVSRGVTTLVRVTVGKLPTFVYRLLFVLPLLVGASACSFSPKRIRGPLKASTAATLVCDWAGTRALAASGWRSHTESNPILGPAPSTQKLDVYFLTASALIAAGVYLIPDKYDWILMGLVTGAQTKALVMNTVHEMPLCGLYDNEYTR
jgi:hypothetical protein